MRFASNLPKLYLAKFLSGVHLFSAVLVPFFLDWGKISFSQILFLQAWFMFWIFALEVPTGAVADRFGRKMSMFSGLFIYGIATVIYASKPSFYIFLLGEFLMALGNALISGADSAILYDTLKAEKREKEAKLHFGRVESAHLSGILFGSILGGFVASSFGLRHPVLLTAIPRFLGAFVTLTIKEPSLGRAVSRKRGYFRTLFSGVSIFKKSPALWILAFDAVSIGAVSYFILWFYQPTLSGFGFPIGYFGLVHASLVLGQILLSANFPLFEKVAGGKRKYLFYSALGTGLSILGLALSPSVEFAIFFSILGASLGLTRYALISSYMNKYLKSSERATAISTLSMAKTGGIALGNLAVGGLAAILPGKAVLLGLGGLAIAFSFFSRVEESHLRE